MAAYVFYAQSEEEQKSIVDSFGAKGISGQGVSLTTGFTDALH